MKLLFEHSYGGKIFRPKPEIYLSEDGNLLIVATPWGSRTGAQRAIQVIRDYHQTAVEDLEATSPFERLTCLTPLANNLRTSLMLVNDSLYVEENRNEYVSSVELFVASRRHNELSWAKIGQPYVYLYRGSKLAICVSGALDLSQDFLDLENKEALAPLPREHLGTTSTSNFSVHSMRVSDGDHFILASRPNLPANFTPKKVNDVEGMVKKLSDADADMPFWLSAVEL